MVDDDVEVGPSFKLPLPVGDGREWGNDEEGAADSILVAGIHKGERLDGLPQTHLVG